MYSSTGFTSDQALDSNADQEEEKVTGTGEESEKMKILRKKSLNDESYQAFMKGNTEPKSDPDQDQPKPRVIEISEDVKRILDGMKASEATLKHDLMKIVRDNLAWHGHWA